MTYQVLFSPQARRHLARLRAYIADQAGETIADRYVDAVVSHCEGLDQFPHRGTRRDDLRPGLRIISYRKRTDIGFLVEDTSTQVVILGVAHGGQDYRTVFAEADPDGLPTAPDYVLFPTTLVKRTSSGAPRSSGNVGSAVA